MDINYIIYVTGFVLAIGVCWNLGRIFYVPMIIDLAFDLALRFGLLSGWDIRLLMMGFAFAFFLWVLYLSGAFNKSTFAAVMVLDVALIFAKLMPELRAVGSGMKFWNATSEAIILVWLFSTFIVALSVIIRSTIVARIHGDFVDILTNPKKRFLIPIAAWSGTIVLASQLHTFIPEWLYQYRFVIAGHMLAWGWFAMELPFLLMYRRLKRQYNG